MPDLPAPDLPCSRCGEWVASHLTVCPECGADPDDDVMPCGECEDGTVAQRRSRDPRDDGDSVWIHCPACLGTREAPAPFYEEREAARATMKFTRFGGSVAESPG